MQKILFWTLVSSSLSACVSDDEFAQLRGQNDNLRQQVSTLQKSVTTLESEMGRFKGQPIVKLPTGSPTVIAPRKSEQSEEDFAYQGALSYYKGGSVKSGNQAFRKFNADYPQSKYRPQALYYVGQSAYTLRDYIQAEQALEELVFQGRRESLPAGSVELLEKVYRAEGNQEKLSALQNRLNSTVQSVNESTSVPVPTFNNNTTNEVFQLSQ